MSPDVQNDVKRVVKLIKGKQPISFTTEADALDSDNLAVFLGRPLYRAGMDMRLKIVGDGGRHSMFQHIYIEVFHPDSGTWLAVDPWRLDKNWDNVAMHEIER